LHFSASSQEKHFLLQGAHSFPSASNEPSGHRQEGGYLNFRHTVQESLTMHAKHLSLHFSQTLSDVSNYPTGHPHSGLLTLPATHETHCPVLSQAEHFLLQGTHSESLSYFPSGHRQVGGSDLSPRQVRHLSTASEQVAHRGKHLSHSPLVSFETYPAEHKHIGNPSLLAEHAKQLFL
jgi:hypothetical protein